jgi:hypothetical protein
VREVALDHSLHKTKHGCSCILATAGAGLDVLICPAAWSGGRPFGYSLEDLGKCCFSDGCGGDF